MPYSRWSGSLDSARAFGRSERPAGCVPEGAVGSMHPGSIERRLRPSEPGEEFRNLRQSRFKYVPVVRIPDTHVAFHVERAARCEHHTGLLDELRAKLQGRNRQVELPEGNSSRTRPGFS